MRAAGYMGLEINSSLLSYTLLHNFLNSLATMPITNTIIQ